MSRVYFPKGKRHVPDEARAIEEVTFRPENCHHERSILVDETKAEIECGECKAKLNPIWALIRLARQESRHIEIIRRSNEVQARLAERSRTKCQHCGQMTRIKNP